MGFPRWFRSVDSGPPAARIGSLPWPVSFAGDRHQRENGESSDRYQHGWVKHHIQIERPAGADNVAECPAEADEQEATGNNPEKRPGDVGRKSDTGQSGGQVDEPEREERN